MNVLSAANAASSLAIDLKCFSISRNISNLRINHQPNPTKTRKTPKKTSTFPSFRSILRIFFTMTKHRLFRTKCKHPLAMASTTKTATIRNRTRWSPSNWKCNYSLFSRNRTMNRIVSLEKQQAASSVWSIVHGRAVTLTVTRTTSYEHTSDRCIKSSDHTSATGRAVTERTRQGRTWLLTGWSTPASDRTFVTSLIVAPNLLESTIANATGEFTAKKCMPANGRAVENDSVTLTISNDTWWFIRANCRTGVPSASAFVASGNWDI